MNFPNEMQQPRQSQQNKANAIKRKIAQMQAADPHLSFQQCWESLQKLQPHLFEEPDEAPDTGGPPMDLDLPPNVSMSEAIRLFKQMSPGALVQAHLAGMLPDGTPWSPKTTLTVMAAGNPPTGAPYPPDGFGTAPWRNSYGVPNAPRPRPRSPLDKRIHELMELNPGLDLKTALEYLHNEEPELFPEDERHDAVRHQTKVRDQVQKLHDAIDDHRKKNPHHSFAMAYAAVTQAKPELVDGLESVVND